MRCARCQWEGPLARIEYVIGTGDITRTAPLCFVCRIKKRHEVRELGGKVKRLVPLS